MKLLQNEQLRRKRLTQEEKPWKIISKKITEEVIYGELFITKILNQKYDSWTVITDSVAMSQMVNMEENMTNLHDAETRVTIGDCDPNSF